MKKRASDLEKRTDRREWLLRGAIVGSVVLTLACGGDGASGPALPGPASRLAVVSGDKQTALAGNAVGLPLRAKVTDAKGTARAGDTVTFAVTDGGGTLSGTTVAVTDASGVATGPLWTLGKNGGAQAVTATSGLLSAGFSATIQTSFKIDLRYAGTAPTGEIATAFEAAVDRISAMIVGDLPDAQIGSSGTPFQVTSCNSSFTGINGLNEVVDDVVIYAKVEAIDGVGKVLGTAGPCLTRTSTGLTALGIMRFDSADLTDLASKGRLSDVVLHEMLHVIGIGTLWNAKGLLVDTGTVNVRVTGPLAAASCANDHGGASVCVGAVPAENCQGLPVGTVCGAGTINAHWKESTFRTELMTGYAGTGNPLARMSVQALADLGYVVHLGPADAYTVPTALMDGGGAALRALEETPVALPEPMRPKFVLEPGGRVRPISATPSRWR